MAEALPRGASTAKSMSPQSLIAYSQGNFTSPVDLSGLTAEDKLTQLQAFIDDSVNDGDYLIIPPGIYESSSTTPYLDVSKSDLTIDGTAATILWGADVAADQLVLFSGNGNGDLTVSGLQVDGNRYAHTADIPGNSAFNISIQNYETVDLCRVRSVDPPFPNGSSGPRCVNVNSSVSRSVMDRCKYRNGYSQIRNRAYSQEYYGCTLDIDDPNRALNQRWTYTASGSTLTTGSAHTFAPGDTCILKTDGTYPSGAKHYRMYYVLTAPTTTTLTLSESQGGPVVTFGDTGTGVQRIIRTNHTAAFDRFFGTDLGEIGTFIWKGGRFKCHLPVRVAATLTPSETASKIADMTCSDDGGDALFTAAASHSFAVGDTVAMKMDASGTSFPGGFSHKETYYVHSIPSSTTLKLCYGKHDDLVIPYQSAEVGTLTVKHLYRIHVADIDGLLYDCPNAPETASIEGLFKATNTRQLSLRSIHAPSNVTSGAMRAILNQTGSNRDGFLATANRDGWRANVSIADVICEHGGYLGLAGECQTIKIDRCQFGNPQINYLILFGMLARHCEVNDTVLTAGDSSKLVDIIEGTGGWDDTLHSLVMSWCHFAARATTDRHLITTDFDSGGFYRHIVENLGAANYWTGNSPAQRLSHTLLTPGDPRHKEWHADDVGTGANSEAHPTEVELQNSPMLAGMTLTANEPQLSNFRRYIYSAGLAQWLTISPNT